MGWCHDFLQRFVFTTFSRCQRSKTAGYDQSNVVTVPQCGAEWPLALAGKRVGPRRAVKSLRPPEAAAYGRP